MLGAKRNHGHNGQKCSSCLIGLGYGNLDEGKWVRRELAEREKRGREI